MTRTPLSVFQGQKVKGQGHRAWHIVAASRTACSSLTKHRQCVLLASVITSAEEVMYSLMLVVSLLTGLHKNHSTDFHKIQ